MASLFRCKHRKRYLDRECHFSPTGLPTTVHPTSKPAVSELADRKRQGLEALA